MKKAFLLLMLIIAPILIFAGNNKSSSQKVVLAYKIKNLNINLDGKLTEQIWQKRADKNFIQRDPVEGASVNRKNRSVDCI